MTNLLAKSVRAGLLPLTLHQHLLDTEQAAARLFREGSRWGQSFLRFFKIPPSDHQRFLLHLRLAALFHDLGKANRGFQDAMRAGRFLQQPVRHEHLSALVLAHPAVDRWLATNPELDRDVIVAAVLSHHLKAARDGDHEVMRQATGNAFALHFDDTQIRAVFSTIAEIAGLRGDPPTLPRSYHEGDQLWGAAYDALFDRAERFSKSLGKDLARQALCLATKAGVIAADSVASAMFRERLDPAAWIDEVAHMAALDEDAVEREILAPRIAELNAKWKGYHPFQDGAAHVGPRALLLAGCGTGKTIAAWRWADSVARDRTIGRVVFLYPTRGTATEGFRDYVGHAPEGKAELLHGTARYELEGMVANPDDQPPSIAGKSLLPTEEEARLFSLGLWSKRYFSATVDQFLGFMQHDYRGLCMLPALADAAVIFDEIHSYDAAMWQSLVDFLHAFDVPVLCMTATLPPTRREQLDGLLRAYPDASERAGLADLQRLEQHPRYFIEPVADETAAFDRAVAAYLGGERVLWVVNTVRRCQSLAARLTAHLGHTVLAYHSRFKLADRAKKHAATIDAFRRVSTGAPRAAIAVTTQVCEMSLDLDADVLLTEHAPITSLVQRFGRANRHLARGEAFRARLLTYPPEKRLPYQGEDLSAAAAFLTELGAGEVSQHLLAEKLGKLAPPELRAKERVSRFLTGGYFATPGSLRDTDEHSKPAILASDLDAFLALRRAREPTDGLQLPVPRRWVEASTHADVPTWLGVADGSRYRTTLGFIDDDEILALTPTEGTLHD